MTPERWGGAGAWRFSLAHLRLLAGERETIVQASAYGLTDTQGADLRKRVEALVSTAARRTGL